MTADQLDIAVKASIIPRAMVLGFVQRYDFTGLDLSYGNLQNKAFIELPSTTPEQPARAGRAGRNGRQERQRLLRLQRPPLEEVLKSGTQRCSRSSPSKISSTNVSSRQRGRRRKRPGTVGTERRKTMKLPAGKVIITAALNGAFVNKEMNPNVPEQPEEIAQAALDCYNAGAAIVHIHARDEAGRPTGTKEKFEEIMAAVRGKCREIIVQFSTGGGANLTIEERVRCLDAKPESASLNMGTLMRQTGAFAGTPFSNLTKDIEAWAAKMKDLDIKPEMECYSQSMYRDVNNLIKKELIKPPYYVNFVLGMKYQGAIEATPETLSPCISSCPRIASSMSPPPRRSAAGHHHGHDHGGGVRVGLEDNIYYSRGVLAESNAQLVERSADRPGAQHRAGDPGRGPTDPGRGQDSGATKEAGSWTICFHSRARTPSSWAEPVAWAGLAEGLARYGAEVAIADVNQAPRAGPRR